MENGVGKKQSIPEMSMKASAYLDNTKFWDMGTPERLERLEEFLNKTSL